MPPFRRIVGPGLVANIDTAHDDYPLPNFKSQRAATAKGCMRFVWVVRRATSVQVRRAGQGAFSTRERLKNRRDGSGVGTFLYCGSPIAPPVPELASQGERSAELTGRGIGGPDLSGGASAKGIRLN